VVFTLAAYFGVKTTLKLERKEGQKRGQKGPKKDRKGVKKVDFGSFFRVFVTRFLGQIC
jgi:hypothetical protein